MKTKEKWKSLESKQRFSLRKLSIGVCSVALSMIAISFTSIDKSIVKADTLSTKNVVKYQAATDAKRNTSVNQANVTSNTISSTSSQKTTNTVVPNEVKQDSNKVTSLSVDTAKVTKNKNSQVVNNDQRVKSDVSNTKNVKKVPGVKSYTYTSYVPQLDKPNSWQTYNNNWYHYDNYGNLSRNTGSWIDNNLFYFNNDGTAAKNAWKQGGNNWYYFGNDGHAYRNAGYALDNNSTYYFDNIGRAFKGNYTPNGYFNVGIDTIDSDISGTTNLTGYLWIKDQYGNWSLARNLWKQDSNGKWYQTVQKVEVAFAFGGSEYAGQWITIQLRDGDKPNSKVISKSQTFYIPKLVIQNLSVDSRSFNQGYVSGRVNGNGELWVKSQNGSWFKPERARELWIKNQNSSWFKLERARGEAIGYFGFDAIKYAGQWLTIEFRDSISGRVISRPDEIYIPKY